MSVSNTPNIPLQNSHLLPHLKAKINNKQHCIELRSKTISCDTISINFKELKKNKKNESEIQNKLPSINKWRKVVNININDSNTSKTHRVTFKIKELCGALGIDSKQLTKLVKEGVLDEFMFGRV